MKSRIFPLITYWIIFLLSSSGVSDAGINTWTSHGPDGGSVIALAIDPSTPTILYAGTWNGGVYKSIDGGAHWAATNIGLTNTAVYTLAVDPSTPTTLYAGTWNGGVYKSFDGGAHWTATNTGLTNTVVLTLAISLGASTTLYAGTWGGGVYKSIDGGANWAAVNNGLTNTDVRSLAIDPRTPATLYAGTGTGVFKSIDGGTTWTAANTSLTYTYVYALAINPSTSMTIYAGTQNEGVYKSIDGGTSWSSVNSGLTSVFINALAIDQATPTTLYAGTGGGVFKSIDGGANWTQVNTGLTTTEVRALAIDSATPTTLYAGKSSGGVYKSFDGGANWAAVNTGLTNVAVTAVSVDPDSPTTVYAGADNEGIFKSSDSGNNWTAVSSGLPIPSVGVVAVVIDPSAPTTLYAGAYPTFVSGSAGVYKSSNGGESWSAANDGLTDTSVFALAIDPKTPTTLYAGTNSGVFKSTNGGENWSLSLASSRVNTLVIDPFTSTTLYAGTSGPYGGGVFKSIDGGSSWTAVNTGLDNTNVYALAVDPSTPTTLYACIWGGFVTVYKSIDGGSNWAPMDSGLPYEAIYALVIDPNTPTTLFAGALSQGVYKSIDGGANWAAVNAGLTNTHAHALAIDPSTPTTLYAGTAGGGVFSYTFIYNLTIAKSGAGSGTVVSSPPGINCGVDCNETYNKVTAVTLTATADAGSAFIGWSGDIDCTDGAVTMNADKACTAVFALTHTVTPSSGAHGSINPNSAQTVIHGLTTLFMVTPNTGYHIDSVTGCGGTLSGNIYTTGPITADCTVSAAFAINTYGITPAVFGSGAISPAAVQTVNYGSSALFTVTPNTGYHIMSVTGCGGSLSGNTYITGPITDNCVVTAYFFIDSFTVTISAGANGTASPNTAQIVNYNSTTAFTITPNSGYHIANVTGCGGGLSGSTYTTGPITANCTVSANFSANTYAVTPTVSENGSISPNMAQTVNNGSTTSFTVTPKAGYRIASVSGCGGTLAGSIYTTGPITADCVVTATFVSPDCDLDGDGVASVNDALRALRIAVGLVSATSNDLLHGDVAPLVSGAPSPNGVIDLGDVVVILRRAVGLVSW